MVKPSVEHSECLLYGGAVWRGCRHVATSYPRVASVWMVHGSWYARSQGAGRAELVTLALESGWEQG